MQFILKLLMETLESLGPVWFLKFDSSGSVWLDARNGSSSACSNSSSVRFSSLV